MKKGIIFIVIGTFLFIIGLGLSTEDSTFYALLYIIGGFSCGAYGFYNVFNNLGYKDDSNIQNVQDLSRQYSNAVKKLTDTLQTINSSYMLNLPSSTINQIALSDNPFLELSKHIPSGYPSVPNFCFYMATKCEEIIAEFKLPEQKSVELYNYCLECISEVSEVFTEEEIIALANSYAEDLPAEFMFLSTKINYETTALGLIADHAISNADGELIKKINEYRRKRGYIQ